MSTHAEHSLYEAYAGAATAFARILGGATLNHALTGAAGVRPSATLRGAVADFTYTTARAYGVPQALGRALLNRPVTDTVLTALIYVALVDLRTHVAHAHTIVDQAVRAAEQLGRGAAKGLVNAVLRSYLRRAPELEATLAADPECRLQHPRWWIDTLRRAYPERYEEILKVANAAPVLTLRVNRRRTTVAEMLARLAAQGMGARVISTGATDEPSAICLDQPVPVQKIPGFEHGDVSVQDAGAQYAGALLDLRSGQHVLDACAAPGGKSSHILELADVTLWALDNDAERAERIRENFARLGIAGSHSRVVVGDASAPEAWWDGALFDRILADVPCTASGVVRRHPDIKWLRRRTDTRGFVQTQRAILDALWRLLRPGGRLLYATCSVFPEENRDQVDAFAACHADAQPLDSQQLFPHADHDGFYYAPIIKRPA